MSLLHEYIRELLSEDAKGIADLPSDSHIRIWSLDGDDINIQFTDAAGNQYTDGILRGLVVIRYPDRSLGPCGGAMIVAWSSVQKGWGPLLYDIAIEYATQNANGLIADRDAVSPDALKIWDYYLNSRSDVKAIQLDNNVGELTPDDKSDDCNQDIVDIKSKIGGNWTEHPLSKRYTKAPTTINALRKVDRLIEK